jgi:5-methylthioribose kinase
MPGITAEHAAAFAIENGLAGPLQSVTAVPLGGGVSNDTVLVEDGRRRVVVKRALGVLRTEQTWHASARRALDEAVGLRIAGTLTPDAVPAVLAVDESTATIALTGAPPSWCDWKSELLHGSVDPDVGVRLGTILARWHRDTADDESVRTLLPDLERMESLRITPFHGVVAGRHPRLASHVRTAMHDLRTRRECLVHGDFSPKNVLVGEGHVWVIDFEVAHVGDPVFDIAFLQAHLLLKSLALARCAAVLRATADAFLRTYSSAVATMDVAPDRLALHVGCLVLARVDGTSVVDYLSAGGVRTARDLGTRLVNGSIDLGAAWREACGE